jgi:hypothetical protein
VSSILAQEAIKVIQGFEEYRAMKQWPEKTGQPLRVTLFLDLKNNRYSAMKIDRNPRCIVCGKDGTARETAGRGELPLEELLGKRPDGVIRKMANLRDETLTAYLENSHGTTRLENYLAIGRRVRRGDYLRILGEAKNGEVHESILRLI